jgi:hypothetical protein
MYNIFDTPNHNPEPNKGTVHYRELKPDHVKLSSSLLFSDLTSNSIRPAFRSAYVLVEMWISFARGSLYPIKTMSGRRRFICGWDMPRKGLDISKRIRA